MNLNQGSFIARGTVVKNASGNDKTILKVDIDSTNIYSDNNLWKITKSKILVDSSSFKFDRFNVSSNNRSYLVDGSVSVNPADTLHLEFKGIDIAPLNFLMNRKKNNDPAAIALDLKGELNGKILLTNVYKSLLLAGDIDINKFSILGSEFGNISVESSLDNTKKIVNLRASNNLNSVKMFDASGTYDPASKKIDLTAVASKLPISFLNPLLKMFASDISGTASGKVNLSGATDNLFLTGAVKTENASLKITYLQTKYTMSDSVRFDKKGIKFNNVKLTDVRNNSATLSGYVNHKNFKDYSADLIININSSAFQVLNTQPKDNPMFYGTAYASGVAKIKSDVNGLSFDIIAKTGKNSKMSIPLNKSLSVSEYSYITFEDSSKSNKLKASNGKTYAVAPVKQTGMDLNINLEVTPDAVIEIIFDSRVGDVMKGQGSSENLNVNLNKKGDFTITGDYLIEKGDYIFTLGPIINKPFSVENGGKIMFNGDLNNAEIDLKASYLNMKVALETILEDPNYSKPIRVQPQINLSGKLFNPVVVFDIYLPDSDEPTRTKLRNAITTQEELTRQVSALLLINNFISTGGSAFSANTNAGSAMAATSFEMISNQLSNMLSKLATNFDIGLNIRPGSNAITPQEAQLALSTQLLGNKVVLNGNFDVRGAGSTPTAGSMPGNNTNQLTGDFDAELKLTEKLRFKVFNRFNDTYTGSGQSPYTQGVGIFYKQDFNKFYDLFRKESESPIKRRKRMTTINKE